VQQLPESKLKGYEQVKQPSAEQLRQLLAQLLHIPEELKYPESQESQRLSVLNR
jgi:hypothetical protein